LDEQIDTQALLDKAKKPGQDAMVLHPFYKGKMETVPRACVRDFNDFAIWYTPGVAEPCKAIAKDKSLSYEHTSRANTIAVVSDGTRVLGLGDIGPEAAMPVMEGKGFLFKYLGGVDAIPLCIDTKDPDEIVRFVKLIAPSFGGINLEDIANPKCFYILDKLRAECSIPVWHDDQQGTATITVAAVMNALKLVGKKMNDVTISLVGAGAANVRIQSLLVAAGADPKKMFVVDSRGILGAHREDKDGMAKEKLNFVNTTNAEGRIGGIAESLEGTDVMVGCSTPGPGTVLPEWVSKMATDSIVFPCANPVPEIWPWEAKAAGAKVIGTGRSDFPNQVNNSLGFPGIFRGTLDVRARTITDEMCIAAAEELAKLAEEKGLTPEYIVPTMDDWEVFPREAASVGIKAIEQGVAGIKLSWEEIYENAKEVIKRSRDMTQAHMDGGFIPPAPI